MPHRVVCVLILIFWTIAAGALFTRDLLPGYLLSPPPDLRTIAQAAQPEGPTRWSILAIDPANPNDVRSVGQITTESRKKRDGWVRMTSQAWLDSAELLGGPSPGTPGGERLGVVGACEIDTSGNLQNFRVAVRLDERSKQEILSLEGRLKKGELEVITRGPISMLNGTRTIPYQPRGIVQNSLGPLDWMPGLQVGQTWETQVVSPLTGGVQACRVEVVGTEHIIWGNTPVTTMKVVTRMAPLSATTWVRPDGLVLRQDVPLPSRTRLILDRLPDDPTTETGSEKKRR